MKDYIVISSIIIVKIIIMKQVGWCSIQEDFQPNHQSIAEAISVILKNITVSTLSSLDITLGTSNTTDHVCLGDTLTAALFKIDTNISYRISNTTSLHWTETRRYNILMIDGYESFQSILKTINPKLYDFTGYYIIVLPNIINNLIENFRKVLSGFFDIYILNVVILHQNKSVPNIIDIYTYFPFSYESCHNVIPVLYNRIKNGRFEKNIPIFPNKVNKFYGCNIQVVVWHVPPLVDLTKIVNGRIRPHGIEGNVLSILAERLNFTCNFLIPTSQPERGVIFANGSSTGAMNMMIHGKGNLTMGSLGYTYERSRVLSGSISYYYTKMVFAIPPEQYYSSFHRLLFPFHYSIWVIIGILFIITFVIFTILKLFNKRYLDFVVGAGNSSAYLQMFNTCFGGTMPTLPRRNFARTVLMIWIVSTSVLRTSYQGVLFTFLQKKEYMDRPTTIKGMISLGYIAYVEPSIVKIFSSLQIPEGKYKFIYGDLSKYFDKLYDPNFKGMVLRTYLQVNYYNSRNRSRTALKILPENLVFLPMSILYKKNSYLKIPFDNILWRLMGSGIIEYWASQVLNRTKTIKYELNKKPQITNNDLIGCYQICGVLFCVAILVFLIERLSTRVLYIRRCFEFFLNSYR